MLELPPISTAIQVELQPLMAGLNEATAQVKGFKANFEQLSPKAENWIGSIARGGAALKGIQASVSFITAGVELWKARQAEVAGELERATNHYLNMASAIQSVPIFGTTAGSIADMISGGAMSAAKDAMAAVQAIDAHTERIARERENNIERIHAQIKRANAEMLQGLDREIALANLAHEEAVAAIQKQVRLRKLGHFDAVDAIAAEEKRHAVALDRMRDQHASLAAQRLEIEQRLQQQLQEIALAPLRDMKRELETFGMGDLERRLFDFQRLPGVTAEAAANFRAMATELDRMRVASQISDELERMRFDLATVGMDDLDRRLFEIKGIDGIGDQISQFQDLVGAIRAAREELDMSKEVDRFRDGLKGVGDVYLENAEKLKKWLEMEMITEEEFGRGLQKLQGEFDRASPREQMRESSGRLAPLIRAGSAEAMRLQFQLQNDTQRDQVPRKQLSVMERHTKILESIDRKIDTEVLDIG